MAGHGGRFVEAAIYLIEMTELGLLPVSQCFDLKNCRTHILARRIEQLVVSSVELLNDDGLFLLKDENGN